MVTRLFNYFVCALSVTFQQCTVFIFVLMLLFFGRTSGRNLGAFEQSNTFPEIVAHWQKNLYFVILHVIVGNKCCSL